MRTLLFLLLCISTSFAIAQISPKAVEKNKEAEIDSLESEMMNFFQATLERNYGRKDALDLLVKGNWNGLMKNYMRVVYSIPILLMELFYMILARCLFQLEFLGQNIVSLMSINRRLRV